jgi:putative phosphoesterase
MLLAVVANSDGRAEAMASAMEVFLASAVDLVVHCGDVGGRHVLDAMSALDCAFVWGDRDRDRMGLLRYAQSINVTCFGVLGELEIDEKKIVILHGDDRKLTKKILDEQQYDYVLLGHDLWAEDKTVGRTRILNPGPLHGAAGRSALLLDPATGKLRLLAL